jgi:hypothetical protein
MSPSTYKMSVSQPFKHSFSHSFIQSFNQTFITAVHYIQSFSHSVIQSFSHSVIRIQSFKFRQTFIKFRRSFNSDVHSIHSLLNHVLIVPCIRIPKPNIKSTPAPWGCSATPMVVICRPSELRLPWPQPGSSHNRLALDASPGRSSHTSLPTCIPLPCVLVLHIYGRYPLAA